MANGGRSHRRWPADLEEQVFIKRPHAVEQYRERARLPPSYNFDRAEADLRSAICAALRSGDMIRNTKNHGDPDNEFVVRVAPSGFGVVYALVEKGASDGKFPFMCHTVFDQSMFQKWNEEGKVATLGDIPGMKEALKEVKPVQPTKQPTLTSTKVEVDTEEMGAPLMVFYKLGNAWCVQHSHEDDVHHEVTNLLGNGIPFTDIRVFKRVALTIGLGD